MTAKEGRFRRNPEAGQAMLFTVLGLGVFLVGAIAFAVDLSNIWFSRQSAQTAADAACTAGAMDMLVGATNGSLPAGAGFTPGTAFDCNANPGYSPCSYAALNGFSSSINQSSATSGTLGNNVYVDFPSSVPGVNNGAPSSVTPNAFIRVAVTNNVPTFFAGMLRGLRKQSVSARSIWGVVEASSPIPILVLNPVIPGALSMNGGGSTSKTGDIAIAGGPSKSIQVNSDGSYGKSGNPVSVSGGPTIDLCAGGNGYCGSSMGVWGTQGAPGGFWNTVAQCTSVNTLCTGTQTAPQFNSPSAPIADPLATISAPAKPSFNGTVTPNVPPGTNGCPATTGNTCDEYTPGYYPNGITVSNTTAIFDPGIYYVDGSSCPGNKGSLCEDSNSCIRPSSALGDGSGGTIFYFNGVLSVYVIANGGRCGNASVFNTSTGGQGLGVKCTSSTQIPGNLPATLSGSVLLAPCQKPTVAAFCASASGNANCNLNFGDPLGTNDPYGEQRGILFFQNRAMNAGTNPSWGGGGSMLLAGTMYFHQCVATGTDTGQGCSTFPTAYNDVFSLGGTPSSSTYVLGDVIADQLSLSGNAGLTMDLNPSAAYTTLKAALVQ
jgi:Putative Flp pilus-assembly TadE/G-like